MNNKRRKSLSILHDKIEEIKTELETIRDGEQEYVDNIPESLQSSDKYEAAESAVLDMDDIINSLDDSINTIKGIII